MSGCVGKSSLVLRYVEDKFNSGHLTTLQVCSRHNMVQSSLGVRSLTWLMVTSDHLCHCSGRVHDEEDVSWGHKS